MTLTIAPSQEWYTAQELAEAGLPDLPSSKKGVLNVAERSGWREAAGKMRRRAGRGGGFEFHWSLLPRRAQVKLIGSGRQAAPAGDATPDWTAFDRLPEKAKDKARDHLDALVAVETLIAAGHSTQDAVSAVADLRGCSASSVWGWRRKVQFVDRSDWLPALAPRHATAKRKVQTAEMHPEAWEYFKADYLRLEAPTLETCYRRTKRVARKEGWAVPSAKTFKRTLDRTVSKQMQVLARKGAEAVWRLFPHQVRDKGHLHALQLVEADYHKWDVFVEWDGEIVRPQMVAFKDVYSGKALSFAFQKTACWSGVQQAFGQMVEEYGFPHAVYIDNGREFATKQFTGGTTNRFRWVHADDDVPGILVTLGIEVHFTTPYRGQSKNIERTFGDYAREIAKDPRFAGAYVGNKPDAKPENYGSRAIPIERFMEIVAEGIAEHNARSGRRAATAGGRSFDETFASSYATAPIRKATAEQRRLWLMGAKGLTANRSNGELRFMGARFWAPFMAEYAGQKMIGRFDPMKLDAGMHVYTFDNRYVGETECIQPAKYNSLEDARRHEKARSAYRRAITAQLKAERALNITQAGRMLDAAGSDAPVAAPVEARVLRPEFGRKREMPTATPVSSEEIAARDATVARLSERAQRRSEKADEHAEARARFKDAIELEERIAAGENVSADDRDWLRIYQEQPEYRGFAKLRAQGGDAVFG